MNRKLESPVIVVMVLVAVAVAATGAYFIWCKSFQQKNRENVTEEIGLIGSKLKIVDLGNDNDTFYITLENQTGKEITASDVYVEIECNGKKEEPLKITGQKAIPDGGKGDMKVSLVRSKITSDEIYTIRITANGVTTTEKYSAI